MSIDWQTALALGVVLLALSVLIRRTLRYLNSKSTSSCGGCPNKTAPQLMKTTPFGAAHY